jgi:sugar lactone lactonase YvrE
MTTSDMRTLLTGLGLVESPRWFNDRLYFSDWSAGEVIAVDLDGQSEVFAREKSLPLCTAWHPDGRLVIVSSARRNGRAWQRSGPRGRGRRSWRGLAVMSVTRPRAGYFRAVTVTLEMSAW